MATRFNLGRVGLEALQQDLSDGEQHSGVAVVHQQRSMNSEQSAAKPVGPAVVIAMVTLPEIA